MGVILTTFELGWSSKYNTGLIHLKSPLTFLLSESVGQRQHLILHCRHIFCWVLAMSKFHKKDVSSNFSILASASPTASISIILTQQETCCWTWPTWKLRLWRVSFFSLGPMQRRIDRLDLRSIGAYFHRLIHHQIKRCVRQMIFWFLCVVLWECTWIHVWAQYSNIHK